MCHRVTADTCIIQISFLGRIICINLYIIIEMKYFSEILTIVDFKLDAFDFLCGKMMYLGF